MAEVPPRQAAGLQTGLWAEEVGLVQGLNEHRVAGSASVPGAAGPVASHLGLKTSTITASQWS